MIKKLVYKLLYKLRLMSATKIARKIGVTFGNRCQFLDDPLVMFGSEPYLVTLGNHVELTNGVRCVTHDGAAWVMRDRPEYSGTDIVAPIVIGNNVFVGLNSVILPGVTIGDDVIIGTGSVVTRDIPSGSIAAGVPAKVIGQTQKFEEKMTGEMAFPTKKLNYLEKIEYFKKNKPEWFERKE